jgi:hypothetical protein
MVKHQDFMDSRAYRFALLHNRLIVGTTCSIQSWCVFHDYSHPISVRTAFLRFTPYCKAHAHMLPSIPFSNCALLILPRLPFNPALLPAPQSRNPNSLFTQLPFLCKYTLNLRYFLREMLFLIRPIFPLAHSTISHHVAHPTSP